ncbi:UvrD-helicase domain-containing protein [Anaerocolumna sp. MB42-C2]|uniref:UvrD-helicase domain-containing protein n=1 Tax=Anaerocolumna sp. MB42-C2 TaxID=3070997 RepID=UPI0027E1000E|nr:UvrD-helicase domain-containing protein [Anaerocolumna sp. MB42-C2]WMJ89965.1 hypothetical protein RBU59_10695 [Anaerocolumna sp. MB42-C2]
MTDEIIRDEAGYLAKVQKAIHEKLDEIEVSMDKNKQLVINQKKYLWGNIYEMDLQEIASNREDISRDIDDQNSMFKTKRLLEKLLDNTYFGRIDFVYEGESDENAEKIYIGLGGFSPKSSIGQLVYDWRAPISSLYYDYEKGPASYEAPAGDIAGKIILKRQFKIRKGIMEYAFDGSIKIDDDILQRELSQNGSVKMRNIVSTIQREQNLIVRDKDTKIMVVQGVAGSGKTSIALHRIAYLLYKNRKNINSSNIIIISPNAVFSDYISNILPELGEENICEMKFDELAHKELKGLGTLEG